MLTITNKGKNVYNGKWQKGLHYYSINTEKIKIDKETDSILAAKKSLNILCNFLTWYDNYPIKGKTKAITFPLKVGKVNSNIKT